MGKVTLETSALLVPAPVVLLSSVGEAGTPNVMGVSWTGVACGTPPMVSVAIRPERVSYRLIRETGEFVLNIPPPRARHRGKSRVQSRESDDYATPSPPGRGRG